MSFVTIKCLNVKQGSSEGIEKHSPWQKDRSEWWDIAWFLYPH